MEQWHLERMNDMDWDAELVAPDGTRYGLATEKRLLEVLNSLTQSRPSDLEALVDELEPAWREAYSEPGNWMRSLLQRVLRDNEEHNQHELAQSRPACEHFFIHTSPGSIFCHKCKASYEVNLRGDEVTFQPEGGA